MDTSGYLPSLKAKPQTAPDYRHQEEGIKVAKLLGYGEEEHGAFIKVFRDTSPLAYQQLHDIAKWVAKKPDHEITKGRKELFMKTYRKKFL